VWACGAPARWLPRTLAGAVLAAATLAALRIDPAIESLVPFVRRFVVVAGAVAALGIARKGAEVRCRFAVTADALHVEIGSRRPRLVLDDIRRLDWAPPFAGSTNWLPAAVAIDREGRSWRIPALVEDGAGLIEQLLRHAGRNDLDGWADVRRLRERMGRSGLLLRVGYALALAVLLSGLAYYLH